MSRPAQMSVAKQIAMNLPRRPMKTRRPVIRDFVKESYEQRITYLQRTALTVSIAFAALWIGTLVSVKAHPEWFKLTYISACK